MSIPISVNPNNSKFWNAKLATNQSSIIQSPIYKHKCRCVISELKGLSGKMLDIGIGYGHIEELVTKRKLKLELYGIDISKYAIEQVKSKFIGNFKISVSKSLPYRNEFFDCVLLLDVVEHLTVLDARKTLSEINRVLRRNGVLILSIPLNETSSDRIKNGHIVEYTEKDIYKFIEKNGFTIKKTKLLTAFSSFYKLKSLINTLINCRRPNLVIVTAKKNI